jgi:hypothetical protein
MHDSKLLDRWFETLHSLEDELIVTLNESPVIRYCFIEFTLGLYRNCSLAQPEHTALMQARLSFECKIVFCFDETVGIHDISSVTQFILSSNFSNAVKRCLIIWN